jgi:hypothetical protein
VVRILELLVDHVCEQIKVKLLRCLVFLFDEVATFVSEGSIYVIIDPFLLVLFYEVIHFYQLSTMLAIHML